jgi:hypothetical protein
MMSLCGELEQLHILLPEMLPQLPEFPIVLKANRDQLLGGSSWICFIIQNNATIERYRFADKNK